MNHYHIELYDKEGKIIASCGVADSCDAFMVLARRIDEGQAFDFVTATCYRNQDVCWEVEIKS